MHPPFSYHEHHQPREGGGTVVFCFEIDSHKLNTIIPFPQTNLPNLLLRFQHLLTLLDYSYSAGGIIL